LLTAAEDPANAAGWRRQHQEWVTTATHYIVASGGVTYQDAVASFSSTSHPLYPPFMNERSSWRLHLCVGDKTTSRTFTSGAGHGIAHLVVRIFERWAHWGACKGEVPVVDPVATPTKTIWTSPVPPLDPALPGGYRGTHWQVVGIAGCAAVAGRTDLSGWHGSICYCEIANPGLCEHALAHLKDTTGLRVFYGCAYLCPVSNPLFSACRRGVKRSDLQYTDPTQRAAWRLLATQPKYHVVGEALVPLASGFERRERAWCSLSFCCVDPGEPSDSWMIRGYGETASIQHIVETSSSRSHFVVPMINQVLDADSLTRSVGNTHEVLAAALTMVPAQTQSLSTWCVRQVASGLAGVPDSLRRFFRTFEAAAILQTVHWQQRGGYLYGHHATMLANCPYHAPTPPAFLDAARGFYHEVVIEATERRDERCWLFRTVFPKNVYVSHHANNGPISIPRGLMAKAENLWFSHRKPNARPEDEEVAHATVRAHTCYALDPNIEAKTPYQIANQRAARQSGDPAFLAEVVTIQSKLRAAVAETAAHSTWTEDEAKRSSAWFCGPRATPGPNRPAPSARNESVGTALSGPARLPTHGCDQCGECHPDNECSLLAAAAVKGRGRNRGEAGCHWGEQADALATTCCGSCQRVAPPSRRWKRGVCNDCWSERGNQDRRGPSKYDLPAECDWIDPVHCLAEHPAIGPGFTSIPDGPRPVRLQPREPVEKKKARREGTTFDDGNERPSRVDIRRASGRPVANCAELVGISLMRIPGWYTQSNKTVRNALLTRALAAPKNYPDGESFEFLERNYARIMRCLAATVGVRDPLLGKRNSCPSYKPLTEEAWLRGFDAGRQAAFREDARSEAAGKGPKTISALARFDFMGKRELDANFGTGVPAALLSESHCCAEGFCADCGPACELCANARGIMVPTLRSHRWLGRHLRPLTKLVHQLFGARYPWYYCAGSTPGELNAWFNGLPLANVIDDVLQLPTEHPLDGPHELIRWLRQHHRVDKYVFVNSDFSGFDQSHSKSSMAFVRRLLITLGWPTRLDHPNHIPECPFLEDSIRAAWDKPKGFTSTGVRFSAATINASGRDDTALLNAVNNLFVQGAAWLRAAASQGAGMTWADLEKMSDAEWEAIFSQYRLIVLGDDSMACVPEGWKSYSTLVNQYIGGFGFETKTDCQTDLTSCVFLGQRPWPTTRGLRMAPTLGRRLYKMQWCCRPPIDSARWLHSTSWAMLSAYPYWIGGRALAAHGLVKTAHVKMRLSPEQLRGSLGPWDIARARGDVAMPTQRTYEVLESIYGLPRASFDDLEAVVTAVLPSTRGFLRHPVLDRVAVVDAC